MAEKPHLKPGAADIASRDSFANFLTRTGIHADNISGGNTYRLNPVTRNRMMLEWAYRGSWMVGIAVDAIAEDMTREGVDVFAPDNGPELIEKIEHEASRTQVWQGMCDAIKWSRLYGGAIGYLMIDGQDPATPLNLDTIGQGQFRGVMAIDRWCLQPTLSDLIQDLGPQFGLPKYYDVIPGWGSGLPPVRIHHSRAVRLDGVRLPLNQRMTENMWGMSIMERIYDRLTMFDSTTNGSSQLVNKAHLRIMKVKGLRDIISLGGAAMNALTKQVEMIRVFQSNEGITLLDADDEMDVQQYSFSGLSDMIMQSAQQLSGALQIPLVRLFGQSPAGLNSTGDSDWENYHAGIKRQQETDLRAGIEKIYHCLYRSTCGESPSKTFRVDFRPLRQMTDEQAAAITERLVAAILEAFKDQVIDRSTVLRELRRLSQKTGVFSNITDEDVEKAKQDDERAAQAPPNLAQAGIALPGHDPGSGAGPAQPPGPAPEAIEGGAHLPALPAPGR